MTAAISIAPAGPAHWVTFEPAELDIAEIEARCDPDQLKRALAPLSTLGEIDVVSARVNRSGRYQAPPLSYVLTGVTMPTDIVVENLPPFCDIVIALRGAAGHISTVTIWVPVAWNERFLGTLGGGNRTDSPFGFPEFMRTMTMPSVLRNGFATAATDGGNRRPEFVEWGLIEGTNEVDEVLTENWIHRGTHEMTVVAKVVIEAIHGRAPLYSYAAGCSGGGRQALVEAQRYPKDYDGLWSSDPAINYTRFIPAELWPAIVMRDHGAVAPEKFDAFRRAAIEMSDGIDGLRDGIIGAFDPCTFDPRRLIGQDTDAGIITADDATVVQMIWDGPRTRDGAFLWYGLHPGAESWGRNWLGAGLCLTAETEAGRVPMPFDIAVGFLRTWVARDRTWDWRAASREEYERLFTRSVTELAAYGSDDPDLSAFAEAGGKLILSHGASDSVIPYQGSVDYYRRVIDTAGSEDKVRAFARLFVSEGDGHGIFGSPGPGLLMADAMAALMRWVEEGIAPDEIVGKELGHDGSTVATRPVYAYPNVPAYLGVGDPVDAASFRPVHYFERGGEIERAVAVPA